MLVTNVNVWFGKTVNLKFAYLHQTLSSNDQGMNYMDSPFQELIKI